MTYSLLFLQPPLLVGPVTMGKAIFVSTFAVES